MILNVVISALTTTNPGIKFRQWKEQSIAKQVFRQDEYTQVSSASNVHGKGPRP